MAYKDRGGFYRPKYSHNIHKDAELERRMENATDVAVLAVKAVNPVAGEKLDDVMDTYDMIAPKNQLNGGSTSLRPFDNILFNNFVPTKAKLNSALRNANQPSNINQSLNSNQPNNNFMSQTVNNINNIPKPIPTPIGSGQSYTKAGSGIFSTKPTNNK